MVLMLLIGFGNNAGQCRIEVALLVADQALLPRGSFGKKSVCFSIIFFNAMY